MRCDVHTFPQIFVDYKAESVNFFTLLRMYAQETCDH